MDSLSRNAPLAIFDDLATPFPFFSLPAETRNQIYGCLVDLQPVLNFRYRNEPEREGTGHAALPLHALCAASTRLRAEFHPIWLTKVQHVVPLKHVQKYIATFEQPSQGFPANGTVPPTLYAPEKIRPPKRHLTVTLSTDTIFTGSIGIYVDILPIIKIKTAAPTADIKFAVGLRPLKAVTEKSHYPSNGAHAGAEAGRLSKILGNRNKLWLKLLQHGVCGVEIDGWGMAVRIKLEKNAVAKSMGDDWAKELATDRREFEEKLGLQDLRCVFLVVKD